MGQTKQTLLLSMSMLSPNAKKPGAKESRTDGHFFLIIMKVCVYHTHSLWIETELVITSV